jgi:hypothetical protein
VSSWRIHNAATTIRQSMLYAGQGGVGLTVALNSAYSFGVSGAAFFSGFIAQESATLTDFWLFVNSFVGTWGSTDQQINVEIRHGLTNSNIPGSTLVGSFAITLTAGVTGWKKHTLGSPIMLQAGGFYTFVVADNDGSAANHVVMRGRGGASASLETMLAGVHPTTNGFSTAASASSGQPAFAMKQGGILYAGGGWPAFATVPSGTYARGMRFAPKERCTLVGAHMPTDNNSLYAVVTIKLFADATTPASVPLLSYTSPNSVFAGTSPYPTVLPFPSASWYVLEPNTFYRFAYFPPGATTIPRTVTMDGNPDAELLEALMPFGNAHYTRENAGVWDDSATTTLPVFGPVIVPNADLTPSQIAAAVWTYPDRSLTA